MAVAVTGSSNSAYTHIFLHFLVILPRLYKGHVTSHPVVVLPCMFPLLLTFSLSFTPHRWLRTIEAVFHVYRTDWVGGSSDEGQIILTWPLPHSDMALPISLWPRSLSTASVPRVHSEWSPVCPRRQPSVWLMAEAVNLIMNNARYQPSPRTLCNVPRGWAHGRPPVSWPPECRHQLC